MVLFHEFYPFITQDRFLVLVENSINYNGFLILSFVDELVVM